MDNKTVQAVLSEYGKRVKCINFDNNRHIFININRMDSHKYPDIHYSLPKTIETKDIEFKTINGTDFILAPATTKDQETRDTKYKIMYATECLQYFIITDTEDGFFDPLYSK